jgi:hypothetical protein
VTALATPELTSDRPLGALKSPKSRLQEYTQRLSGERPQYRLLDAVGPDHDKVFRVEVVVGGRPIGVGEGHSRRIAETDAADHAIETLRRFSESTVDGSAEAPELVDFRDAGDEGDAADWKAPDDDPPNANEPWIEFDLDTLVATPDGGVADGGIADDQAREGGAAGRDSAR